MQHVVEFHKQFKNFELKGLLWKLAKATMKADFNATRESINKINEKVVPWLLQNAKCKAKALGGFIFQGVSFWSLYFKYHRVPQCKGFSHKGDANSRNVGNYMT